MHPYPRVSEGTCTGRMRRQSSASEMVGRVSYATPSSCPTGTPHALETKRLVHRHNSHTFGWAQLWLSLPQRLVPSAQASFPPWLTLQCNLQSLPEGSVPGPAWLVLCSLLRAPSITRSPQLVPSHPSFHSSSTCSSQALEPYKMSLSKVSAGASAPPVGSTPRQCLWLGWVETLVLLRWVLLTV